MVCSGDLQVVSSGLVGVAAAEDFLLPLATCPQGTPNGELVATDWSGGGFDFEKVLDDLKWDLLFGHYRI